MLSKRKQLFMGGGGVKFKCKFFGGGEGVGGGVVGRKGGERGKMFFTLSISTFLPENHDPNYNEKRTHTTMTKRIKTSIQSEQE